MYYVDNMHRTFDVVTQYKSGCHALCCGGEHEAKHSDVEDLFE